MCKKSVGIERGLNIEDIVVIEHKPKWKIKRNKIEDESEENKTSKHQLDKSKFGLYESTNLTENQEPKKH